MKLSENYASLAQKLGELKVNFPALAARLGGCTEAQRAVDDVGVKLIELEAASGIAEARQLLAHARTFAGDLPRFQTMLEKYSAPLNLEKAHGGVTPEELEDRVVERARLVSELKKSITMLTRMDADVAARRKKFSADALEIAGEPDPLSAYERENFERLYADTRAASAGNSVFEKILKPLEPLAA